MTIRLNKALFEKNLNTRFWLRDESGERVHVDLVELSNGHIFPPYEHFSLLFRGERSRVHSQRSYAFEHDVIGGFDLFLTPVARNEQGTFYEAVFNQLIEPSQLKPSED
jgi:Domain of unknown function (DUF6916)